MDRPAQKPVPSSKRGAEPRLHPDQMEVYEGLLLALLARKRLLVLVGDAGSGRAAVFRHLVEHVAADGALVLPVAASPGAQVEDLITAAGDAALPCETGDRDFDTLVEELEERLDLAGAGLLAVDNAAVLAPPTVGDLIELTRSETPGGRSLQVLLCGSPELERTLAHPGLAEAVRELGVIYRTVPGAAPSVTASAVPIPAAPIAAPPVAAPVTRPAAPPETPSANASQANAPANDWDAPEGWAVPDAPHPADLIPPPAPRRRRRLLAGAAVTTLVLTAAAGAGVMVAMPDLKPETAIAAVQRGWTDLRAFVEKRIGTPFSSDRDVDALALAARDKPDLAPPPPAPAVSVPMPPVPKPPPPKPMVQREAPPVVTVEVPPLPPPVVVEAPIVKEVPPAPAPAPTATVAAIPPKDAAVEATEAAAAAPTGSASLPPLVESQNATAATPLPDPDAGLTQRVSGLLEQARRQIAAKRLTLPAGDNAYETVARLREIAPGTPEIPELLSAMEQTYRRWAALAEREGDWSEARRFYERALIVAPNNGDLRDRIKAAGEGRTHPNTSASAGAGAPSPNAPAGAADARPGLDGRDSAVALLRRPADLARLLDGGANPNARVDGGKTLLMLAAEQGLADAARILLDRQARTELRTADGATAAMYAAWNGHVGVIEALAAAGADLDATNDDGKTALMAAAARGHLAAVRALLDHGVAVDRAAGHGWSALMYAANNGHDRVARLLVERGANPFRMDTAGNSALTLGALQGHMQVVEALKPR